MTSMQYNSDRSWPSKWNQSYQHAALKAVFPCSFSPNNPGMAWHANSLAVPVHLHSTPAQRSEVWRSNCSHLLANDLPSGRHFRKGRSQSTCDRISGIWSNCTGKVRMKSSWQWEMWPSLLVLIIEYKSAQSIRKSTSCTLCQVDTKFVEKPHLVSPVLIWIKWFQWTDCAAYSNCNHCHCGQKKRKQPRERSKWGPTFGIVPLPLGPLIMLQTRGMTYLGSFKAESQSSHEIHGGSMKTCFGSLKLCMWNYRMIISFDIACCWRSRIITDIRRPFSAHIWVQLCASDKCKRSWDIMSHSAMPQDHPQTPQIRTLIVAHCSQCRIWYLEEKTVKSAFQWHLVIWWVSFEYIAIIHDHKSQFDFIAK